MGDSTGKTSELSDGTTQSAHFRARIDCLRHLVSVGRNTSLATAAGALLLVLWLQDVAQPLVLGLWLASMLMVSALRLLFVRNFVQHFDASGKQQVSRWERNYALLIGAAGLLWGLAAWMPMTDPEHSRLLALTVILFCILLVSSSALAASRRTFSVFTALLILPLIARFITLDERLMLLFGCGVLAMGAMLISAFHMHHKTIVAALNSQYQSEHLLQQQRVIFESAGEGIVFLLPKPRYVAECNRRFADLFGYPLAAMAGMEPWRWHPDRAQWKKLVATSLPVIAEGRPYHEDLQLLRADGSQFWAEVAGMAVNGANLSAGTVWIVSDISEKRAAQAALRISEARFRDLVRLSSDLYWEQDEHFCFTRFDGPDSIKQNLPLDASIGNTLWQIVGLLGVPEARWKEHTETLNRHQPFRDFIYQLAAPDGTPHWYSINGNPMFDVDGVFVGYHGTASDISLRIESEERFRHLAYHDPLTQLPNRRLLEDRLEHAIRSAHRNGHQLALLLIDLDKFKPINDQFGHASGDQVLETIARRLRSCVRDADTVARLGGDEFVVLLPKVETVNNAIEVAEKIHASIREPISTGERHHRVGSSIGISLYPEHGDNAEALLHHADQAMYLSKQAGGQATRVYEKRILN